MHNDDKMIFMIKKNMTKPWMPVFQGVVSKKYYREKGFDCENNDLECCKRYGGGYHFRLLRLWTGYSS